MTHRQLSGCLIRVTLVAIAPFCGAARAGESDRTQAAPSAFLWQVAEIDLTSSRTYANPYGEIDVTVTFTGPGGESVTRPAFWDGGSAWKVRFAPTAVGTWPWRTECSDRTNDGLHEKSCRLECMPGQSGNPCYRHGFLRVSDNRRHFVHADGTPFFWLGDTHWQMPDTERLDACNHPEHAGQACPHGGQFQHLVADRHAQGFTVYQTRWTNHNHRIDGWYAGMDLPGSQQMAVLKRFFLDLPWHLLAPRFSNPAWAQFTDREESVLATCGQDLFVTYFYGPSRSPGTLRNLDPNARYRADWFDPRIGTWTPIDTDLRADNGQWTIPLRPDGDWVLVVRPDRSG